MAPDVWGPDSSLENRKCEQGAGWRPWLRSRGRAAAALSFQGHMRAWCFQWARCGPLRQGDGHGVILGLSKRMSWRDNGLQQRHAGAPPRKKQATSRKGKHSPQLGEPQGGRNPPETGSPVSLGRTHLSLLGSERQGPLPGGVWTMYEPHAPSPLLLPCSSPTWG